MSFVVQAFEHVSGRLVATLRRDATSQADALRQAEALAGRLSGAVALEVAPEDGSIAAILGAFGDVPDDFADGLAGG
ncbi:hypothetical protein [Methylobacterium organophilum]|uniref:Uncharacterized protein n=1 Tax=Methylobacterium organophilum TaxID=410 RepID=A0ABQ4T3R9_METOR|nr:hypothetical protein [Methylobacterium organophilum]UMY18851.1 hypothetical protein MMB17_05960 [Methylobacterium organophilum]GJE25631.1 hypothetical protein LKMONMHP_0469 [Methylobacterium organophilum]